MTDRKMASIRRIHKISPIKDADQIELASVDGWSVVVRKGEYQEGDLAVYIECDSWVPHRLAPFLSKGTKVEEYNGVLGARLRSVKLRNQLSQGLLLKLGEVFPLGEGLPLYYEEGLDLTALLGIQKWEAPVPSNLAGITRGGFPSFIPKTDQERVQNLTSEILLWKEQQYTFEVSEKLEGSSMTIYSKDGYVGVCSRNQDLVESEKNALWQVAHKQGLIAVVREISKDYDIALQGEIIGPGIQGNHYKLKDHKFFLFDMFNINTGQYLTHEQRVYLAEKYGIMHTPILNDNAVINSVESLIQMTNGLYSTINPGVLAEGVVYKCHENPNISFKVINNEYLLKTGN